MRIPHPWLIGPSSAAVPVARVLAAAQGAIWLVLLIHGGTGLVFGPMGWIATVVGSRMPALAVILLVAPVAWLSVSWASTLFDGPELRDWGIFAALTGPAVVAAAMFFGMLVKRSRALEAGQAPTG
jgi:hypothetical protein